jgi:polar amino acid transport system permease protein
MMLSLGLIAGAYLAEVFRGAFASVDPDEIMAAEAMGMSRRQILLAIELPQMLRFAVHSHAGCFALRVRKPI